MTQDEIIEMAEKCGWNQGNSWDDCMACSPFNIEAFAKLIAEKEREACALLFDEAMPLVPFVQNDQGGCLVCGFTPKLAAETIRARGQA